MDQEGDGPNGKFFPASVQTKTALHPSDYFLKSQACERCTPTFTSVAKLHAPLLFLQHRVSQKHRVMQEVDGVKANQVVALGARFPLLLFSGIDGQPLQETSTSPKPAPASLHDVHSIVQVKARGPGDFVLEYPSSTNLPPR